MMHRRNETARWQLSPSFSDSLFLSLTVAISNDVSGRFACPMCLINHGLPLLPQQAVPGNIYEEPIESADSTWKRDDILNNILHGRFISLLYIANFLKQSRFDRAPSVRVSPQKFSKFFNPSTRYFDTTRSWNYNNAARLDLGRTISGRVVKSGGNDRALRRQRRAQRVWKGGNRGTMGEIWSKGLMHMPQSHLTA